MLETIYVTRHGFRSNWVTDNSGNYSASIVSPTGIPSDPPLTAHGVDQAKELGKYLVGLEVKPERIFSSPFYRCLQTVDPVAEQLEQAGLRVGVFAENGIGEWYGRARFEHPSPASLELLHRFFPRLSTNYDPVIIPSNKGESMREVHDRTAYALARIIEAIDREWADEGKGPKAILLCAHAAPNIAIGRNLVGDETFDVKAGTCSLSTYERRVKTSPTAHQPLPLPTNDAPIPIVDWRNGKGVGGGWDCVGNGDCSFLSGGEERNWWFNGDEDWDFPVATKQDEVKPQANEFGGPGTVLEAGRMEKQAEEHAASAKI